MINFIMENILKKIFEKHYFNGKISYNCSLKIQACKKLFFCTFMQ